MKKKIFAGLFILGTSVITAATSVTLLLTLFLNDSISVNSLEKPKLFSWVNTDYLEFEIKNNTSTPFVNIITQNENHGSAKIELTKDSKLKKCIFTISFVYNDDTKCFLDRVIIVDEINTTDIVPKYIEATKKSSSSKETKFVFEISESDLINWTSNKLKANLIFSESKNASSDNEIFIYSLPKDSKTSERILDNKINNELTKKMAEVNKMYEGKNRVNFVVELCEQNLYVGEYTVPKNIDLQFINNEQDRGKVCVMGTKINYETKDVELDESKLPVKSLGKIFVEGVLTFWRSAYLDGIIIKSNF